MDGKKKNKPLRKNVPQFKDATKWMNDRNAQSEHQTDNFWRVEGIGDRDMGTRAAVLLMYMYALTGGKYYKRGYDGSYYFEGFYTSFGGATLWVCIALQIALQMSRNTDGYECGTDDAAAKWTIDALHDRMLKFRGEKWNNHENPDGDDDDVARTCVGAQARGKRGGVSALGRQLHERSDLNHRRRQRVDAPGPKGSAERKNKLLCFLFVYRRAKHVFDAELSDYPWHIDERIINDLEPKVFRPMSAAAFTGRLNPAGYAQDKIRKYDARVSAMASTKTFGILGSDTGAQAPNRIVPGTEPRAPKQKPATIIIEPTKVKKARMKEGRARNEAAFKSEEARAAAARIPYFQRPTDDMTHYTPKDLRKMKPDIHDPVNYRLRKQVDEMIVLHAKLMGKERREAERIQAEKEALAAIEAKKQKELAPLEEARDAARDAYTAKADAKTELYTKYRPRVYTQIDGWTEFSQEAADALGEEVPELKGFSWETYRPSGRAYEDVFYDDDAKYRSNRTRINMKYVHEAQKARKQFQRIGQGPKTKAKAYRMLREWQYGRDDGSMGEPGDRIDYGTVFGFESLEELDAWETRMGERLKEANGMMNVDWQPWERLLLETIAKGGGYKQPGHLVIDRRAYESGLPELKKAIKPYKWQKNPYIVNGHIIDHDKWMARKIWNNTERIKWEKKQEEKADAAELKEAAKRQEEQRKRKERQDKRDVRQKRDSAKQQRANALALKRKQNGKIQKTHIINLGGGKKIKRTFVTLTAEEERKRQLVKEKKLAKKLVAEFDAQHLLACLEGPPENGEPHIIAKPVLAADGTLQKTVFFTMWEKNAIKTWTGRRELNKKRNQFKAVNLKLGGIGPRYAYDGPVSLVSERPALKRHFNEYLTPEQKRIRPAFEESVYIIDDRSSENYGAIGVHVASDDGVKRIRITVGAKEGTVVDVTTYQWRDTIVHEARSAGAKDARERCGAPAEEPDDPVTETEEEDDDNVSNLFGSDDEGGVYIEEEIDDGASSVAPGDSSCAMSTTEEPTSAFSEALDEEAPDNGFESEYDWSF